MPVKEPVYEFPVQEPKVAQNSNHEKNVVDDGRDILEGMGVESQIIDNILNDPSN